tara:strand:+ start:1068 stop:1250 length:183 start_codon:yes stop_codon:yes gene_type:complete
MLLGDVITSREQITELSSSTLKQLADEITWGMHTGFIRYADGKKYFTFRQDILEELESRE